MNLYLLIYILNMEKEESMHIEAENDNAAILSVKHLEETSTRMPISNLRLYKIGENIQLK